MECLAKSQVSTTLKCSYSQHNFGVPTYITQVNAIYSTIPFGSALGQSSPKTGTSSTCTDFILGYLDFTDPS